MPVFENVLFRSTSAHHAASQIPSARGFLDVHLAALLNARRRSPAAGMAQRVLHPCAWWGSSGCWDGAGLAEDCAKRANKSSTAGACDTSASQPVRCRPPAGIRGENSVCFTKIRCGFGARRATAGCGRRSGALPQAESILLALSVAFGHVKRHIGTS